MLLLSLWAILLAIACTFNDDMHALFRPAARDTQDQRNER